ncbi:MAG TPA: 50S ribosomal protein L25/general stress protein Ctc [Alphaproteobacteria bacterium]|nr:50S ribosomal protein L25/general stress protein Ctc [Alphaproteobacteria bacterium]
MSAQIKTLAAEARDNAGKGAAAAVRRSGRVPAVIYGDKQAPVMITMDSILLSRQLEVAGFFTQLFDLDVAGKKHRVLPRDVQYDPVSDRPLHVDFLRVSASTKVRVAVPVAFLNSDKSPGIKRGGTLNIVHHEIEVSCSPDKIPAKFEVSLEGLNINDAIHLSAVKLPEGVKLTTHEKDFTIATIAVPSAIRAEQEEAAAKAAAAATAAAAPADGAAPAEGAAAGAAAPAAGAAAPAAGGKAAPAADAKKPEGKK